MRKVVMLFVLAGATFVLPAGRPQASLVQAYATATFQDYATMIRSDTKGPYENNVNCVTSEIFSMGEYFLRTVQYNCTATTPRSIVLDFSQPVPGSGPSSCTVTDPNDSSGATLNVCGPNTVADVRLIAGTLYQSSTATRGTTSVSLPFSLQPDFGGTDFELDFQQPVPWSGDAVTRVVTAGGTAVAELYQYVPTKSNKTAQTKVLVGQYYMPLQVTVAKQ